MKKILFAFAFMFVSLCAHNESCPQEESDSITTAMIELLRRSRPVSAKNPLTINFDQYKKRIEELCGVGVHQRAATMVVRPGANGKATTTFCSNAKDVRDMYYVRMNMFVSSRESGKRTIVNLAHAYNHPDLESVRRNPVRRDRFAECQLKVLKDGRVSESCVATLPEDMFEKMMHNMQNQ